MTVVFTNGCFDILHRGHVELLKFCKEKGRVIVGLNSDESVKKIKEVLDNEIRPAIGMDGGDCEFVAYEGGILTLKLQGACSNCPSSIMTLKMGIESRLREEVPDLKEVIQI